MESTLTWPSQSSLQMFSSAKWEVYKETRKNGFGLQKSEPELYLECPEGSGNRD